MWSVALRPQTGTGGLRRPPGFEEPVGVRDIWWKGEGYRHADPGHLEVHEQTVLRPEDVTEIALIAIPELDIVLYPYGSVERKQVGQGCARLLREAFHGCVRTFGLRGVDPDQPNPFPLGETIEDHIEGIAVDNVHDRRVRLKSTGAGRCSYSDGVGRGAWPGRYRR